MINKEFEYALGSSKECPLNPVAVFDTLDEMLEYMDKYIGEEKNGKEKTNEQ